MAQLNKQTGTIITAVVGVLFGCSGILTCVSSLMYLPGFFNSLGYGDGLNNIAWFTSIMGGICTGLAFVALPAVFYRLLVHGRND